MNVIWEQIYHMHCIPFAIQLSWHYVYFVMNINTFLKVGKNWRKVTLMDDHFYSIKSFHFRATSILTGRLLKASSVFMIHLCNVAYCFIFWWYLTCLDYDEKTSNGYNPNLGGPVHFLAKRKTKGFQLFIKGTLALRSKARSRDVSSLLGFYWSARQLGSKPK